MASLAICGLQWGDEGKGKIADYFAGDYNCIVKFNGGDNAGHTVKFDGKAHVLNNLPAASIAAQKGSKIVLASETVFNPEKLLKEWKKFEKFLNSKELIIAKNSHIITELNIELDKKIEEILGRAAIGTTRRGIGPTYANRALRLGIRVEDLIDKDRLTERIKIGYRFYGMLFNFNEPKKYDLDDLVEQYYQCGLRLKDCMRDMSDVYKDILSKSTTNTLYEGCQGSMLDISYGTYPYVTSSSSTLLSLYTSCASRNLKIDKSLGIIKSYTTRVGRGKLPTEITDSNIREFLLKEGEEYGATTGRTRRIGWLDLPPIKRFVELNSIDEIAMTKIDVLFKLSVIKICIDYKDGTPIYREFTNDFPIDSENDDSLEINDIMQEYIRYIENYLAVPIRIIGVGSNREHVLIR